MPDISRPKKRGAPLGNQNALRHGVYSKLRPSGDVPPHVADSKLPTSSSPPSSKSTTLEESPAPEYVSLTMEIAYLRAYYQRIALSGAIFADPTPEDLEKNASILRMLSVAAVALTRLIQIEIVLRNTFSPKNVVDSLLQAQEDFEKVRREYRTSIAELVEQGRRNAAGIKPTPSASDLAPAVTAISRQLGCPASDITNDLTSDLDFTFDLGDWRIE